MAVSRILQPVVPSAEVHVDRAHLDAVLAGIANDLGRRVESHGLGIQQRTGEHIRMVALEPG